MLTSVNFKKLFLNFMLPIIGGFRLGNNDVRRNGNHRLGDRLPQKRKLDDRPTVTQPKRARVAVTFKDQTYSEQCHSSSKPQLYIAMNVMVDGEKNEKESKQQNPLTVTKTTSKPSSPIEMTKSGRRKRKPVGKDYFDVTKRRIPGVT